MKILNLSIIVILFSLFSCKSRTSEKEVVTAGPNKIEAYYFHFSNRCVTCKAVESEAKADIETLYGGKIKFQSVNLDNPAGKSLAEKLNVSGQTLLVVKGNTKVNLTNDGFMYARSNPEKFKSIVKEKVDPLL